MSKERGTKAKILESALACAVDGHLTMALVADRAGVSRQAVYLHFADRRAVLTALLDHALPDKPPAAASARGAAAALVAGLARDYPRLHPIARLMAGEPAWLAREQDRLADCRALADRFRNEGALAPHLSVETAADLLWTLTSLAIWSDLAARGWTADRYRSHITFLATGAITK